MKNIVQIELTNFCTRMCGYCGQINMKREKGFISLDTVWKTIEILKKIEQTRVGLNHYGEPLLHPDFIQIVRSFHNAGIETWFHTNADLLGKITMEKLSKFNISLVLSGHTKPEILQEIFQDCCKFGLKSHWQHPVKYNSSNLANQLSIPNAIDNDKKVLTDPVNQCYYLREEHSIILWNGDITVCCFDYESFGVYSTVYNKDCIKKKSKVFSLCKQCPGHLSNY